MDPHHFCTIDSGSNYRNHRLAAVHRPESQAAHGSQIRHNTRKMGAWQVSDGRGARLFLLSLAARLESARRASDRDK